MIEEIYQTYRDIAQFCIVYIREAHAADSHWPVDYAKELGINEHKDYDERCAVARRMFEDKKLTIPCLIDGFDNKANDAYRGWPTRVFLVRKDGKLGVAAGRGPWGLRPGLKDAREWLAQYKRTGQEPALTKASDTSTAKTKKGGQEEEGSKGEKSDP